MSSDIESRLKNIDTIISKVDKLLHASDVVFKVTNKTQEDLVLSYKKNANREYTLNLEDDMNTANSLCFISVGKDESVIYSLDLNSDT